MFTGQNFVWLDVKCLRGLCYFWLDKLHGHCQFPFLANEKFVATLTNLFSSIDASAIFFLYKWSAQFYLGTMVLDILLYISLQYLGKSMC